MGCAFRDGHPSLRAVAREFERRELAGVLPEKVGTSPSKLSKTVHDLETKVFSVYFDDPGVRLIPSVAGDGTAGVPGADGWRAWDAARRFLADYYELPAWDPVPAADPPRRHRRGG